MEKEKQLSRQKRCAREMQKKITIILQQEIQDPRIRIINIVSYVEVSRDLSYARVFVTSLNEKNEEIIKNSIKVLQNASGFIRFLLGKLIYLRIIPELTFFYDNSLTEGIRIFNMLNSAVKYDKNIAIDF